MEKEDNPVVEEKDVSTTPKARERFLSVLKKEKGEDYEPKDDDELWDESSKRWDSLKSENIQTKEMQAKLVEKLNEDPTLGLFLSEIIRGTSVPKALSLVYGDVLEELEDADLEDYEAGYQENKAKKTKASEDLAKAESNAKNFMAEFDRYVEEKGYDDATADALWDKVYNSVLSAVEGNVSMEFVEYIDKGSSYDEDIAEAAESGVVEGKNQNIEAQIREDHPDGDGVPDLNNATAQDTAKNTKPSVARRGLSMDQFPISGVKNKN